MHLKHYLSKVFSILFIFCCCFQTNAQQIIQQKVSQQFATAQNVETYTPLTAVESNTLKNSIPEAVLPQKQFFQIQTQQFQSIKENNAEQLVLSLPIEGQQIEFQLVQADIFSDNFQVVAASGASISQDMGAHYWGTAIGDTNSFAAFSFVNNELIGGVQIAGKQYTLGKMKNSDTHILYNNADLKSDLNYECQELLPPGMSADDMPVIDAQPFINSMTNCVNIHMEIDHSVYLAANSDANVAATYITGVFSQVAALYANESINVQISYLQVWDTPSPYGNGTELDDLLAQNYGKTQGDLVHVVHMNGLRGLAYRDVICNNFVNVAASGIQGSYDNIPAFSWDVEVITHEIGHNLGSPHTHGCYWNGNGTAIDGCGPAAGYGEGCDAELPTKGTIMSYCHLVSSIGIDFNLGFGQQPGDLIRSRVNNSSCLTQCNSCPNGNPGDTCDDGDACTTGDVYAQNCECAGTFADADGDGVCDVDDICEFGDDNLDSDGDGTPDACDFSNGSTDSDQDGVPDDEDVCPDFDDNLIGTSCDDGDVCTDNDIYTQNCECEGTLIDTNDNGVCDIDESGTAYSLTFSVAEVDCQNQTINIDFAVQAANANSGFEMAEQNYRMSFDRAIANPTLVQELGLSGVYPLANNEFALYSPHSLLGSMDTVISYNIALQSNSGLPIGTSPVPIGRLGFDIVDDSECFDIKWHTENIYPQTVVVEAADGALIPINNGNFTDITICLDDYCPACDVGATCDDGDDCTINDAINDSCECEGTLADADEDGICDSDDICPNFNDELIGTSCDDNNDCTVDDIYTENCECEGTLADADEDGICDSDDICPNFNDELIGTSCDDNNACTVQDIYTENCECEGTYLDSDEDGVCDAEDDCPDFNDELIGTSCDDNNDCTVNDIYTENCECMGTFADADEDGFCDAEDVCPEFDDELIGTPCDDGNACTVQDVYGDDCECAGTYLDSDQDGVCDEEDACPVLDNSLIGTSCDDGDACTTGDIYTPNCECAGTFADGDNDGVCDADDICLFGDDSLDDDGDGIPNACDFFDNTDSDGDGVPDSEDICPGGDDTVDADENGIPDDCDTDGDGVPNDEDVCPGGDDNLDEDGNGIPDDCEGCPTYNFIDYPVDTYGNNQDRGTVATSDDGTTIELNDNAWKAIVVDYEITPYTVIEFDFKSTQIGEIHGVGFDNNTSISSGLTFKLYGTQNWGNSTFNTYSGSGEYEHFVIPVGEFYTGQAEYFFFVSDHDAAPQNGNSFFANLKIYEDTNGDGLCDSPDDCADADGDTVCDDDDVCPAGDDTIDSDGDGAPDACDLCPNDANNACDTAPDYCESTGFNTDYEYIDRVVFGNIDNTSGNDGGYGDFTNQVVTVGLGDIVPLGLTPGFSGSAYNEGWRVWIDFNKDGDFNDDGERVFSGNGAGVLSSTVEIPADAALGLTGMRVSMRWNRFMNPCSDFAYGEVEDYTVNITAEAQNYPPLDLRGEEYFVESPAMRIFPNPATEYINISFQNIREGGSIGIYSTSGQLIGTHNIDAEHLYVPLNQLPAGVYILHLRYGDDTYATERFVKISE